MRISLQKHHFSSVDLFESWVCQSPMFCWPSRSVWCLLIPEKGWKKCVFSHEKSGILTFQLPRTLFFSLTHLLAYIFCIGVVSRACHDWFWGETVYGRVLRAVPARHRLAFASLFFLSFFLTSLQCYHCNLQWNSKSNLSLLKGVEN